MNIIGIIPARMASNRFPGKPLAEIMGKAMIYHVYWRSRMARSLNEVYLATCDKEIERYCRENKMNVIMTKDTHRCASDRAAEALEKIEKKTGRRADIVVMIQGDEPMLVPEMIDAVIRPMLKDKSISVANLMYEIKNAKEGSNSNVVKVVTDKNNYALYFSREAIPSQKKAKKDTVKYKQIAIIPFQRDFLITFNKLPQTPLEIIESVDMLRVLEHGHKVKMVMSPVNTYGVDTPGDFRTVRRLMSRDHLISRY